ncbi:MAG TPA: SnoaL-like domain-containing protein [Hanamia sp.]|nr:SnoaL-like domain-containing protein [Hanamia sp.]
MNTEQIANRLAELCRKGDFESAQKELFAEDAVSIEPEASAGFEKVTKGLAAIAEKRKTFF